jgi:hypothetical protein
MVRTPPAGQGAIQPSSGPERAKEASPALRASADKIKQASLGKIVAPQATFQRNAPPVAGAVAALRSSIPGKLRATIEKRVPNTKDSRQITKAATGRLASKGG